MGQLVLKTPKKEGCGVTIWRLHLQPNTHGVNVTSWNHEVIGWALLIHLKSTDLYLLTSHGGIYSKSQKPCRKQTVWKVSGPNLIEIYKGVKVWGNHFRVINSRECRAFDLKTWMFSITKLARFPKKLLP